MKLLLRSWVKAAPLVAACLLGWMNNSSGQEAAGAEWTEQDTELANRYLAMLEANPEYSMVLELLWDQYANHGASDLLMARFSEAASELDAPPQVRMVYAHLLRKSGAAQEARQHYENLLEVPTLRRTALLGLVDLALNEFSDAEIAETHLKELAKEDGADEEAIRVRYLALADLRLGQANGEAALRVWRELAGKHSDNLGLLQELAHRMINAGYLPEAIGVYEQLKKQSPVEERIALHSQLGALYELADEFDLAAAALNAGREATHFKHHSHLEFLSMLVRLYERHGKLEELEASLLEEAGVAGARSEKSLYTLVRFYDLTARPAERERWLRELVELTNGQDEYQSELVEVLLTNDQYREAKRVLEELLAENTVETLTLRLLRVRVELSLGGREAGAALLGEFLEGHELDKQDEGEVLRFADEHYLDEVAEVLLRRRVEAGDEEAVFLLAELHQSRGRVAESKGVLENYIGRAESSLPEKAKRLYKCAAVLQKHGLHEEALTMLKEAVAIQPGQRDYLIRLAEEEAEGQDIDEALAIYEAAWSLSTTDLDRADIDQRIHSLLQLSDLKEGNSPSGFGPVPASAAAVRPADPVRPGILLPVPQLGELATGRNGVEGGGRADASRLLKFYADLKGRADASNDPAAQYRAAWWARLLGDYPGAIQLLSKYREANPTELKVERLLLEVAEASQETLLALRQLELLARIDRENEKEYELRRAQIRVGQGDEAFRAGAFEDLERMAAREDADATFLKNLAGVFSRLGRHERALEAYRRAFEKSTLHEKRSMIGELNRLQIQSGQFEQALDSIMNLIQEDHDILQRRKELASQLNLAEQHQLMGRLQSDYKALQWKYPLEPFYSEALALVAENLGKSDEAFDAIKRAYYGSRSRDGHLLERMRQLAAKTRDVAAAIYYQRQLVSAPDHRADASEWQKLIRMLEMDIQVGEADQIRVRLESKFAQDPEVLEELAAYYLDIRQPSAARRILGRLARLRPWHVDSLLRLGILEKEAGNDAEAAKWFYQALEHTREIAETGKPEVRPERYPLRGFSRESRPELSNQTKSLDGVVEVLDDMRPIDDRLRVQLAHYFESGRPEYQAAPAEIGLQRLRVIEELGEIIAGSDEDAARAQWAQAWKEHPPRSMEENFWVAWCSGEKSEAWKILEEQSPGGLSSIEEFLFCLYGVHAKQLPSLIRWVQESDVLQGARHRRLTWLVTAVAHYCSDTGELPPDGQLNALLSEGSLSSRHIYALLNHLSRVGRYREALKLGEMALDRGLMLPADFDYSLASLAFGSGDTTRQREHLEAVIGRLDPSNVRFQEAAVTLFRLLEPGGSQRDLAGEWIEALEKFPENPRASFGRGRILHLLGDEDGARQAMSDVVGLLLEQAKAIDTSLTASYLNESALWMSLFDYAHGARSLGLSPVAQEPFEDALRRYDLVTPRAQQAAAHFQNYFFDQLRWRFEHSSFRERTAVIHGYRSLLRTDEEWEALAGSLAGEGHHRDAIGIYERLLKATPGDNDNVRPFLAACAAAREFVPALEYLNRLLNREVPLPEGSSVSFLQQQHALFLSMSDDRERLRTFADHQWQAWPDNGPEDRYYHHALAALLQRRGLLKEAAAVYEEIDDDAYRNAGTLRNHAELLRQLGDDQGAIELLERVVPEGERTPGRPVLEALAELYASTGEIEKLRSLSLDTLETQDDDLAISVASSLSEAGLHREAEGIFLLALRRAKNDVARFHLLAPAIEIALQSEDFNRVKPLLSALCDGDPRDSVPELRRILEALGKCAPGAMREDLEQFFSEQGKRRSKRAVASLCGLELALAADADEDFLAEVSKGLDHFGVRAEELAIGVDRCLDRGKHRTAEYLMSLIGRRKQSIVSFAPQEIRLRSATGNSAAVESLFRKLLLYQSDGVIGPQLQLEIAEAFVQAGDNHRAEEIFEHFHRHFQNPASPSSAFLESYLRFLAQEGHYYEAREVLRKACRKSPPPDMGLIVGLYEKWGRPAELSELAATFDLSSGSVVDLKGLRDARQAEKESLSDQPIRE